MDYEQFLTELKSLSDENYKAFHKRLLKNENINVLGVRVPDLRKIAKKYKPFTYELLSFTDDYYEVTFVKLSAAAYLPFSEFTQVVDRLVPLIDNWASCDCFSAKCIASHREEFKPYIEKYLSVDREFFQRYALTTLLQFYVDEKYLEYVLCLIERADTRYYYVHMAAAWLASEVLVKHFEAGVEFIKTTALENKTVNKAIQKARESFRLSDEQKAYLKTLKR